MKSMITSAFVVTLAGAASAGTSDRYDDRRLDTSAHTTTAQIERQTGNAVPLTTLSSRSKSGVKGSYAYSNPYGVGPYNDSR